jgi:AcrR family transcriptional regulator
MTLADPSLGSESLRAHPVTSGAGPRKPSVPPRSRSPVLPPTEERILGATERCIERLGLRFSMADVAAQAGLSRGSVYLHFGDRATLVDRVLGRVADRFLEKCEVCVRQGETLAGRVGEAAVFIREHLGDRLLGLRLPADEENLFATVLILQIGQLLEKWVAFWVPFLDEAERHGEVRTGLDHPRAAEWIVRFLMSLAVMPPVVVDLDDPVELRAFVQEHLMGLAS